MPLMRMYDPVTLVCCEQTQPTANVIRASLEDMRLRVHLYVGIWKRHLMDFFTGRIPCSDYIIVCAGGKGETEREDLPFEAMQLRLPCVDEEDHFC